MKFSAPGKVHIIGEHSVVYNKPAILASISKRCNIDVEKNDDIKITGDFIDELYSVEKSKELAKKADDLWNKCNDKQDFTELFSKIKEIKHGVLKAGIGKILNELDINEGVSIKINSEIPIGSGLGGSAALAVVLTKAISYIYEKNLDSEKINEIAYKLERYTHGTPSGGDNSICCFGKIILYQKKPRKIESIDIGKLDGFILVYTKKPEKSTGELVQIVRNLEEQIRTPKIEELGKLTEDMLEALKSKNSIKIKEIINNSQQILFELGVSCEEIDILTEAIRNSGDAAKLCGAGGGGIVLCYSEDIDKLKENIKSFGYKPMEVELGVEGVRLE